MFNVKSIEEAVAIIRDAFSNTVIPSEERAVDESLGLVCAADVRTNEDVPHFHRSTVDGYACLSTDIHHASATIPVVLRLLGEVAMGQPSSYAVRSGETVYVPTGGHLPPGADCVVMIEETERLNDEVFVLKGASKSENVFYRGTDIAAGDVVLQRGTRITPFAIGALHSVGIKTVPVHRRLRVAVLSTGTEIVGDVDVLPIGQIRDINTHMIRAYLEKRGVTVVSTTVIHDDFDLYRQTVADAFLTSDVVVSSGGSSVGEHDYTADVMTALGAMVLVHGINIKPGKPTVIANHQGKLFLGLPGQPTSAYMVLNTLFPAIEATLYHIPTTNPRPSIQATLTENVHSGSGRRLYQLVSLEEENGQFRATPLFRKSGMIHSLVQAFGYVVISEFSEGLNRGDTVLVYRLED